MPAAESVTYFILDLITNANVENDVSAEIKLSYLLFLLASLIFAFPGSNRTFKLKLLLLSST